MTDLATLAYRRGDTIWVNRLAAACPGLHPMSTLIVGLNLDRPILSDVRVRRALVVDCETPYPRMFERGLVLAEMPPGTEPRSQRMKLRIGPRSRWPG